jgi:superfamily I DNA/RNA helicase
MEISDRQRAIYDAWETTDHNLLINARAGSGKTTTILGLVKRSKYRSLFLAFNKSIQTEIQAKLDKKKLRQGKAMTLHSLGLASIRKVRGRVNVAKGKNWDFIRTLEKEFDHVYDSLQWEERLKLNYDLMAMNDISRLYLTDDYKEIHKHLLNMDKTVEDCTELKELWEEMIILREKSYESKTLIIDFIDMIYLPVIKNYPSAIKPYYLMIDECQDLNLCQHKLIDIIIKQSVKKWVAVGDKNQAIYGFAGASGTSFDLFIEKGNVAMYPLDICYRCPKLIVDAANEVYEGMVPHKTYDGKVATVSGIRDIKKDSLIICRNTSPLITLFFKLIGLGIPANLKGEDLLNSIETFLKPYLAYSIPEARHVLEKKKDELTRKVSEGSVSNEGYKLYKLTENLKNFTVLADNLSDGYGTVKGLISQTKQIFLNKMGSVELCTIHKAKGLEADVVYILNEDLIPIKFAKSKQQLTQEENLRYVARTRAKEEMYYLNLKL